MADEQDSGSCVGLPRVGSSPIFRIILVRLNGCSPRKPRNYAAFLRFIAEIFKTKTMMLFKIFTDRRNLNPRQPSELSSDKILSNKTASFEHDKEHKESLEKYPEMREKLQAF